MHRLRIALCAVATISLAGCVKGNKVNDQALTTDVEAKLHADPGTRTGNIKVNTANGVVTLSGDVPGSEVELAAMKIANEIRGVQRVNDQLKVNGGMAANMPPSDAGNRDGQNSPPPAPATPPPPEQAPPPASAQNAPPQLPPQPISVTIPAGQPVTVRMIDSIDSAHNESGQTFRATLNSPLVSHGRVVVPAGEPVSIILEYAKGAGRIRGRSELELRLGTLTYHGRAYRIDSTTYEAEGKARGKSSAVRTGIGTAAGAVIGALAGGGKGAGIGAVVGGGGAAGFQLATHGQQVKVPSESLITFRLERPLTVEKSAR
jgi:hypothetical protein